MPRKARVEFAGAVYSFYFDTLHRKTAEVYPADASGAIRSETFLYDIAGNLIRYDNPAGQHKHLAYDNRNRIYDAWWDDWVAPEIVIGYDAASRVTRMVTNTGQIAPETTLAFGYDDANRKIWEEQTLAGYPTRYLEASRDADGNRWDLVGYTGGHLDYLLYFDYNQRNELHQIQDGGHGPYATYTRDARGNVLNRRLNGLPGNGVNFAYDELDRITQVEPSNATQVFARSHYQYDPAGREVATWRDEDNGYGPQRGERFAYAASNQLASVLYEANNVWLGGIPTQWLRSVGHTYTPDTLNRQSVNDNGHVIAFATNNNGLNQYTTVDNQAVGYDANFNLSSYGYSSFTHNAENQLVGGSLQATYDGMGRCVRRTVNGVTTLYTYDGWNPILEWDGAGNYAALTIYGDKADEVLAHYSLSNGALIYTQDKQGNVIFVQDGNMQLIEKYSYDAFGKPTIFSTNNTQLSTSAVGNRFLFQGREWIPELGIYDYRHRMYHPSLGRFLQTDPTGFDAGDMNLFRYCGDDPVDQSDPTGLVTTATGSTIEERQRLFYGDTGQGSLSELDHRTPSLSMATVPRNDSATEYKDGFHAAMSQKNPVGDAAAKSTDPDSPEAWAPYGRDPRTKMWGTGTVHNGNGIDPAFKDRYTEGNTERVQTSTPSRGDLPAKYDYKGFVLGHKFFNNKFVDRDIRRAQDAGKGILLVLPPRPGARDKGYLWKYWEPGHNVISNY